MTDFQGAGALDGGAGRGEPRLLLFVTASCVLALTVAAPVKALLPLSVSVPPLVTTMPGPVTTAVMLLAPPVFATAPVTPMAAPTMLYPPPVPEKVIDW